MSHQCKSNPHLPLLHAVVVRQGRYPTPLSTFISAMQYLQTFAQERNNKIWIKCSTSLLNRISFAKKSSPSFFSREKRPLPLFRVFEVQPSSDLGKIENRLFHARNGRVFMRSAFNTNGSNSSSGTEERRTRRKVFPSVLPSVWKGEITEAGDIFTNFLKGNFGNPISSWMICIGG